MDPHPPPKPTPPLRSTQEPTKQVVDEYVNVVGVENMAGTPIQVLDYARSMNKIQRLPAIPQDVRSVTERLQKLQQEKGGPWKDLVRVNLQTGPVGFTKGVSSNFARGLYLLLSPAAMGIILQPCAETLTPLSAMVQRVQGPQRQVVPVYNVPDANQVKEAGNGRMLSDPVKVNQLEEGIDTDKHIRFEDFQIADWSAYGAIQSVGWRKTLKGPACLI